MTTGVSDSPVQTFVKLKPLITTVASSQLAASFEQMAESLKGASFSGIARFTLVGDPQTQSFVISLQERSAKVESDGKSLSEKVDFEIITAPETWLAIAEGKLAPLAAFTQGKMRVRGDYKLGQRIIKQLAANDGRTSIC